MDFGIMAPKILKILAVSSALALGGGYVWWSQKKAEEKRARAEEQSREVTLPGSKSALIAEDAEFPTSREEIDRKLNEKTPQEAPAKTNGERTVLPGSKSFFVQPVVPEEKPRSVLPGSKSIDRILQPPDEPKPESP
jgi:hypothetical protein